MKYYYLTSSLPDLPLDDTKHSQEMLEDYLELISRNLSDSDRLIFECLLHYSDNQNLLYVLFHEYYDFQMHGFNQPGAIDAEVLRNYRREHQFLPEYMNAFLKDFSGSFTAMSLREMEHHLHQYFYSYQESLCSIFLNTYCLWRFRLKRTVAELNRRTFPFLHTQSESEEPFFERIRSLHSMPTFEEVSHSLMPLLEISNLEGIERQINAYYFQFADSWIEPFTAEHVFGLTLKIIRLHRWKGFASKGEQAQNSFEQRIEELKKREPSPRMTLI